MGDHCPLSLRCNVAFFNIARSNLDSYPPAAIGVAFRSSVIVVVLPSYLTCLAGMRVGLVMVYSFLASGQWFRRAYRRPQYPYPPFLVVSDVLRWRIRS